MPAPFLLPLRRPLPLILGFSSAFALHRFHPLVARPVRLEAPAFSGSKTAGTSSTDAKVPIWKNGRVNPAAYGQISAGSLLGLASGVALSTFSKPLTMIIGLAILGVQYLASMGINIIPKKRLQRYVMGINLRSAIEDNLAFKFSFGMTFLLASFAEL